MIGEPKNIILAWVQKTHKSVRTVKVTGFVQFRIWAIMQIWNGEPKNVILVLVQKAHFAVRACKLPGFMQHRIWPTMLICGNSGLPFAVVPCFHQCNLYMKRKLREWRTQECNPCFGTESPLRSTGLQTTRFHAAADMAYNANLRKLGASFRRGTVFQTIQSTYENEATGMENPQI